MSHKITLDFSKYLGPWTKVNMRDLWAHEDITGVEGRYGYYSISTELSIFGI